ncbi:hypothetical protein NFI96_008386 [Prochilodus magdalenae]|nr:hypothetical protein NFI96_008386 [Prochilodus magdalenae]
MSTKLCEQTFTATCSSSISSGIKHISNLSLRLGRVPTLWKTSCLVPVPKKGRPSELNDFRPVALTSHVMKTLERLLLHLLRPQVQHAMDPLQFAYREKVGVEDDLHLVSWITDYLTGRPQYVRLRPVHQRLWSAAQEHHRGLYSPLSSSHCTPQPSGDFNHVTMARTLPNFTQYVDCPTREERTLDLLYANVKDAYSCSPLPPLGGSDHNLVNISSKYVPQVKSQPVTTRTVRRWSEETSEVLQDCFETTDWTALYEPHGEDIDRLTECITDYINFCVDSTVPTRTVKCYPNNKPWVTKDIKALLNKKKRAFRAGDREEVRTTQRELKRTIREAKDGYRRKLEWKLQQNNMREVWSGMRTITGFRSSNDRGVEGSADRANCKL